MTGADLAGRLDDELAELAGSLPPIVCFANDWRGDPTSKHHIMRRLARHVPVLWVESAGMRRPSLTSAQDLKRITARLVRRRSAGAMASADGVRVISPLSVPLPGNRLAERFNAMLYRRAVETARTLGPPPLLWVYTPTVAPYLAGMPRAGLVYHCVDRWWAFSEYEGEVMRRHHADLCQTADVVFASSAELLEDCRPFAAGARLMPHGVDWDHFARAASGKLPRPGDIADLDRPLIGFFGLLHDWIDQELLVHVAEQNPDAVLVLIGKARVDVSRLTALPNVRWLGQKPYASLPAYAATFRVAVVPFVSNQLTAAVNPIKLLEYLSAGVPVVATALPEIVRRVDRPGITVAQDSTAFAAAVRERLQAPLPPAGRQELSEAQRNDSWTGRCVAMLAAVHSSVPAR